MFAEPTYTVLYPREIGLTETVARNSSDSTVEIGVICRSEHGIELGVLFVQCGKERVLNAAIFEPLFELLICDGVEYH